jgi:hypothetical protein
VAAHKEWVRALTDVGDDRPFAEPVLGVGGIYFDPEFWYGVSSPAALRLFEVLLSTLGVEGFAKDLLSFANLLEPKVL